MKHLARLVVLGIVAALMVMPSGLMAGGHVSATASHPHASDGQGAAGGADRALTSSRGSPSALGAPASVAGAAASGALPCANVRPFDSSVDSARAPATVAPAATAAVNSAVSAGACPSYLFPPRPSASPAQIAASEARGWVEPLYSGTPAPIGLADYGLAVRPNGTQVASVLTTTSVRGQVDANATGVQPLDLYNSEFGPDAYSLQLNAVLTKVVLFGHSGYEFWTQNVLEYFPSAHQLYLITNVWNFSSALSFGLGNAIYQHGANGSNFGFVYEAEVGFSNITYPFNLTLYLNSTLTGGRDAVYFTGDLRGPGESIHAPFDYLVFNSIASGGSPLSSPAVFSANGTGYDPIGLTNDFELDFGGPGDGSQASLLAGDADLGLAYWNASGHGGLGGYDAVPSAFNYGGETGETATGATVTWSDTPGGPGGLSTYGTMRTGPGILEGLWNASGPEGAKPITIDSTPSNAFQLLTPVVRSPWTDIGAGLALAPMDRSEYAEAYSPALGATILFGGWNPQYGPLGDTWEFASGRWAPVNVSGGPPARWGASLVYDAADGYLVLFGGRTAQTGYLWGAANDTWIYNVSGWHELFPTRAPSPRSFVSMAYDAADSEVVLFGGGVGTANTTWTLYRDTWTFHAGEWTNITATSGAPPPARLKAGVTYDATDSEVVMVGGTATNDQAASCPLSLPDEWAFSAGTWTQLTPTGAVPPAGLGALWFDAATATTYYYQGLQNLSASGGSCQTFVGNVYAFSAGHWVLLDLGTQSGSPSPRIQASVIDDQTDHLEMLFGGQQGIDGPFFADTWAFNPSVHGLVNQPQVVTETYVGLTVTTHTFWLAPGNYSLVTELSGYDPATTALNVTGPMTVSPALSADPSTGIYTPLWAWSNSQFAAISTSGSGVPSNPYVLETGFGLIGSAFGLYNDYAFPVYPGMFLLDTTASVDVRNPPAFLTATNDFQFPGPELPQINSLPIWFWNVTGVALTGGIGIGAQESLISELGPFAVVFYDSTHNLVDGNLFQAPVAALLFQFGPGPARFTGPSGDNTVWGNRFALTPFGLGTMGLVEVEPNDLIYNNKFLTHFTACSAGDPYQNLCWPVYSFTSPTGFSDQWNITPQAASVVHFAPGFPLFPLTGSIIGTPGQGGNYWWDYGIPPNTFGVLPYDEKVAYNFSYINPGGDYAPLVLPITATFVETGLAVKALVKHGWTVVLDGTLHHATAPSIAFSSVAPGDLPLLVTGPPGYRTSASGFVNLGGENLTLLVPFQRGATYSLTLTEKGLGSGKHWCPAVDGYTQCSTKRSVRFTGLSAGVYYATVARPSTAGLNVTSELFGVAVSLSTLPVYENEKVTITVAYPVLFRESGLPDGTAWGVQVKSAFGTSFAGNNSTIVLNLTNGTYRYRATAFGYVASGRQRLVVDGRTVVAVRFRPA